MLTVTTATFDLIGVAPLSFSKAVSSPKNTGENADAYEERTWRERMHVAANGEVFIPPMALKLCLEGAAQYLGESIPGKGKSTYTKLFRQGTMAVDPMMLGVQASEVPGERLFVPSDGQRGGGRRVWKWFPVLRTWRTRATLIVMDPILVDKPEKIEKYAAHAGKFIGLLRFRPANGGYYGRFDVENFRTSHVA